MITRGYFIGEILDSLTTISQQVNTRCKLNLTDLNIHLENFFKDYLNSALPETANLKNLNDERCNTPGLDLGSDDYSIGFQITSSKSSQKINNTLKKANELTKKYQNIIVLIIGEKQAKYTGLNKKLCDDLKFTQEDIWDINKLCSLAMSLPLDQLQRLHQLVKSNIIRLSIELEIPDETGNFDTKFSDYIESIGVPKISNFKKFMGQQEDFSNEYDEDGIAYIFKEYADCLTKLPRITREFYSFLLERSERDLPAISESLSNEERWFNYNKLKRVCHFPNLDEELSILHSHNLIYINDDIGSYDSKFIKLLSPGNETNLSIVTGFIYELTEFIDSNKLSYQKVIAGIDFTDF